MRKKEPMTKREKQGMVVLSLGLIAIVLFSFLAEVFASKGDQTASTIAMLFSTSGNIFIIYATGRMLLKNAPYNMNLKDPKLVSNYIKGLVIGTVLIGIYVALAVLTKGIEYGGLGSLSFFGFILYLIGFGIQGFSEEFLVRGVIQEWLAKKNRLLSIILPSVFFGLLHLGNDNFSWLAMINTTLIGLLFAVMTDQTGSLWMASGAHSIWNFLLGPFFGLYVSGIPMDQSFLRFPPVEGKNAISGGLYGPEAAPLVTVIIIVAIVIFLIWGRKLKRESAQ